MAQADHNLNAAALKVSSPELGSPALAHSNPLIASPLTIGARPARPRQRLQEDRVRQAILKLYPNDGTKGDPETFRGVVYGTKGIQTETIRGAVAKELAPDSRTRNLAEPSWDIVARVLGRRLG
jgi:hypothetical protein